MRKRKDMNQEIQEKISQQLGKWHKNLQHSIFKQDGPEITGNTKYYDFLRFCHTAIIKANTKSSPEPGTNTIFR